MTQEEEILNTYRTVAVVGLSPKPERASHKVAAYLKEQGYKVLPVNPQTKEILGEACYPDLASVPGPIEVVDVFRDASEATAIAEEAIKAGAKVLWMQEGVINEEAAERARKAGLLVVMDKCMRKEHMKLASEAGEGRD